jgi:hypothetical protein
MPTVGYRLAGQGQDCQPSLGQRARGHAGQRESRHLGEPGYSRVMSITHLKLRISEKFRKAKTTWHDIPSHHENEEIPPPPLRSPAWARCGMRCPVQRRRYVLAIGDLQCTANGSVKWWTTSADSAKARLA